MKHLNQMKLGGGGLSWWALAAGCMISFAAARGDETGAGGATSRFGLEQRIDALLSRMTTQEKIEQLFYKTDGNERLGVPQFTGSDGPHGIGNKAKGWSCFPVTIAMAATWDPDLIQRVGRAIALEQASRGRHRIAGPTLDLLNDPRNGRAPETIGEDPFLGGRISEGFLRGMSETAVFGTVKHYNLNTYEAGRETNNYVIDQRSLVEFWGAHWKRAVQDGGALSLMCAYNLVNGEKCAENHNLIKTVLRDHWGFRGYTMSDWGGFWSAEKAMAAELDFCEGNELYIKELPDLLADGKVTEAQLNNAVRNVLRVKLLSGMIDGQTTVAADVRDSGEHRALVYESGLRSLVLLKNRDAILPLDPKLESVALIGPNAATLPLDGHSSSAVIPSYTISVRQGLESILGADRVRYAKGCDVNSTNRDGFAEALRVARNADVVVFAGGLDNTVEGEGYFIGGDRLTGSVDLPGMQNELISELASVNSNVVLVVISGGTCAVNKIINDVKGLLYAFYPGQEGGRAIADVLLGRENPSGKLPVTVPKEDSQLPPRETDFRDVVIKGVGYRWFDRQRTKPEFAFGAGLSYTTFEYRNLRVTPDHADVGQEILVTVEVANTGQRGGEEVVQLYLVTGNLDPQIPMPVKQLKGFEKVGIAPGESREVSFRLTPEELYVFDADSDSYFVPAGEYEVLVGGASDALVLSSHFSLEPAEARPDLQVINIRTVPPFPQEGDAVSFVASILNRGTGPSAACTPQTVQFWVNNEIVATSEAWLDSIPVGGMAMVSTSDKSTEVPAWTARNGQQSIRAAVDFQDITAETIESNNSSEATLALPGGKARTVGSPGSTNVRSGL